MRYTIELDTSTKVGTDALKQLKKLKGNKTVAIHKWKKLTARDVALPGGPTPTEWQWEEYLNRKQSKGKPAEQVFVEIKKQLIQRIKLSEKSKSLTLDEAIQKSEAWETNYK